MEYWSDGVTAWLGQENRLRMLSKRTGLTRMARRKEISRARTALSGSGGGVSWRGRDPELGACCSRPSSTAYSALNVSPSHGTYIEAVTPVPLLGTSAVGEEV